MNKHLIGSKFAWFIFPLSVISLRMLMDFFSPSLLTVSLTKSQTKTNSNTADPWAASSNLEEKIKGGADHGEIWGSCTWLPPSGSDTSSERDQSGSSPCFAYLKHYQ